MEIASPPVAGAAGVTRVDDDPDDEARPAGADAGLTGDEALVTDADLASADASEGALTAAELGVLPDPIAPAPRDPLGFPGYRHRLRTETEDRGDESVSVGIASLAGLPVVAAVGRFRFLGGSMGAVHGERVARAMDTARRRRLPFVAVIASGGARMQEGMVSLVQMARAAEGVRGLREDGVPVLAHFRHPTTGGVHASYGALADVILADAGATVGFAGPRVVEAVTGERVGLAGPRAGDEHVGQDPALLSHTAEAALSGGLVDELVAPGAARTRLAAWVAALHPTVRNGDLPPGEVVAESTVAHDPWAAVTRARAADRPSARSLLVSVFDAHLELRGDRAGEDDPAALGAVARLGQRTVVVIGTDRHGRGPERRRRPGQATAAGYRKLRRMVELAARWRTPLVAFIDTPGADPSPASDRDGLAVAIAELFVAVLSVATPTVAVVTGEGGSGGALALGAADRLLMQDDAVFEVIAPEGAASILYRDASRAQEVAALLGPTSHQLRRLGIVDQALPGPTSTDPGTAARAVRAALATHLRALDGDPHRLARRRERYGPRPA
jgi:acyl-CoA carboxylase subunit beta